MTKASKPHWLFGITIILLLIFVGLGILATYDYFHLYFDGFLRPQPVELRRAVFAIGLGSLCTFVAFVLVFLLIGLAQMENAPQYTDYTLGLWIVFLFLVISWFICFSTVTLNLPPG